MPFSDDRLYRDFADESAFLRLKTDEGLLDFFFFGQAGFW